ncbi:MAG: carbamoyltransferase HypF [Thermaerobacter sp.]|nr:carbamoyltransferase HypF [Thermaerobacter sp.]
MPEGIVAHRIHVRGVVQGVGFRPFVYRMARNFHVNGWVLNNGVGVEIHVEGHPDATAGFLEALRANHPPAARIAEMNVSEATPDQLKTFAIRQSQTAARPTARISADLAICDACRTELFDPHNRRYLYPYINCTDCGPRYSIILELPYDRPHTTMAPWPLCGDCAREYHDPDDRRFHAQPVACPACGPHYRLKLPERTVTGDAEAVRMAAQLLRQGRILAIKGLGGYHLACDARNPAAVAALRSRKYRKDQAFALMARDLAAAGAVVVLDGDAEALLTSVAAPIVVARARRPLPGVAPDNRNLGVMLPYTPLHHLLFHFDAPAVLVMTSANRSSEPIAYQDDEAETRLAGIADGFLCGERPVARRVDDSVIQSGSLGKMIVRRARGYAPTVVARMPESSGPVLATGADLKNTVTLVVKGQAVMSQHLGDLDNFAAFSGFCQAIDDVRAMYDIAGDELLVAHDLHPGYRSSAHAADLPARRTLAVQHHRAHIAAVLAERGAWDERVIGVAFDGTGYGDDGTIWGGEFFTGSIASGFERVGHLRPAALVGGDAAAKVPVQAAAGFLAEIAPDRVFMEAPFQFPERFARAQALLRQGIRVFPTTSAGRLFDTVAAMLGFTGEMTFEGQAAIWLEHLAWSGHQTLGEDAALWDGKQLDYRPLLGSIVRDRQRGRDRADIAYAFHQQLAGAIGRAVSHLGERHGIETVVLAGGVFQNMLLLRLLKECLRRSRLRIWTASEIPVNDGGISLGQAALACLGGPDS